MLSEKKLKVIKAVLNVDYEPEGQDTEGSFHGGAGPTHHSQAAETFDEVCVRIQKLGPPCMPAEGWTKHRTVHITVITVRCMLQQHSPACVGCGALHVAVCIS